MSTPENDLDVDESSGVTTLRPVAPKAARLLELSEGDSTQYFSATELLERGKALASRASEPTPPPTLEPVVEPEATAPRLGLVAQFRQASFARKASALLLPPLCVLLLAKPLIKKPEPPALNQLSATVEAPIAPPPPKPTAPLPSATLALPHAGTLAHAAADSVATGDFSRAAALYRELSQREPKNPAYREAARILSERAQRSP
jgi:hypothetical protein